MADSEKPRFWSIFRVPSALILFGLTAAFAGGSLLGSSGTAAAKNPIWKPVLLARDMVHLAFGSDLIGDVYVTQQRMLYKNEDPPPEQIIHAADVVNQFAAKRSAPVYMMAIPTSSGIYADTLPANAPIGNEHAVLRTFADQLSDRVVWIETESWLSAEREQYLYYRTDPCWTSYGAYTAYRTAIRKLGFTAIGYDHLVITHFSSDYYGRLAQRIQFFETAPDTIDLYSYDAEQPLKRVTAVRSNGNQKLTSYYNMEASSARPEAVFRTETEPILYLETKNQSSKDLLLLTDSFGSSMIPFLLEHYHTITAVNLPLDPEAYWRTLPEQEYEQVLILCGADTISAETGLAALLSEPDETASPQT
ncbi:MAG TPA: hypothetical protein DCG49_00020 [Ruminococcus sp.]|nr:hypothetical protein [Ruminococcus sp.]